MSELENKANPLFQIKQRLEKLDEFHVINIQQMDELISWNRKQSEGRDTFHEQWQAKQIRSARFNNIMAAISTVSLSVAATALIIDMDYQDRVMIAMFASDVWRNFWDFLPL